MKKAVEYKRVELAERPSLPILTGILISLLVYTYSSNQSSHNPIWIDNNVFQVSKIVALYGGQKFSQLLSTLWYSNLVTINLWQLIGSVYFAFVFGVVVEKRLAPIRFISLVLVGAVLPWVVQFWDSAKNMPWPIPLEHIKSEVYFFGPAFVLFTLSGAFMMLAPEKNKINPLTMRLPINRKARTEIFNREPTKSITEGIGFAPFTFFTAFLIFECAIRVFIIKNWESYDTMGLYGVLTALAIGMIWAIIAQSSVKDAFEEHPLKHEAVKRYHEMLDLDIGHDNAVKAAARALALPDEQVEFWVKENKGKLRTK